MKKTIFLSNKEMLSAVGQPHRFGTIVRIPKSYIPNRVIVTYLEDDVVIFFNYTPPSPTREVEIDEEMSRDNLVGSPYDPSECAIEKDGWVCKVGSKTRKILGLSIPMKTFSDSIKDIMAWLEEESKTGNVEYYRNNCKLIKRAMEKCEMLAFTPPQ